MVSRFLFERMACSVVYIYMHTLELMEPTMALVFRVLSFDLSSLKLQTIAKPVEIQKPNVELFDDPQHNGQYWGD